MTDYAVESKSMSMTELEHSLDWNKSLAEHCDENMDFRGYSKCQEKIQAIQKEIVSRARQASRERYYD